jgi:protein-disulfide isomerase
MDKRFWAIIGVIIVIFGGILLFKGDDANAPSSNQQPTNHVMGAGKKKVTLVEYGDYQCPVCKSYYPILKQVTDKYGDDITFQFRNLPLSQIHQNAFAGARAAEAAGLQNKYWEMHDMLYENQQSWSTAKNPLNTFEIYAKQLGVNINQFKKDFSSARVNGAINADLDAFAKTKQQQATPSFFINGKFVKPSAELKDFTTLIDPELK